MNDVLQTIALCIVSSLLAFDQGWRWERRRNPHVHSWEKLGQWKGTVVNTFASGYQTQHDGEVIIYRCSTCGKTDKIYL